MSRSKRAGHDPDVEQAPAPVEEPGPALPTAATLLASVDSDALMQELVERLLDGLPSYTPEQVSAAAGVDREISKKLWRAMGLADIPDGEVAFTDLDVEALGRTKVLLGREEIQMHLIVQLARTLGLATARIADSIVDFTLDRLLADLGAMPPGGDPPLVPGACAVDTDAPTLPDLRSGGPQDRQAADLPLVSLLLGELDELVVYLLHRHLVDATARRLATVGEGASSAQLMVGFADLVGYTALSQELPDEEIVEMVDHFEAMAANEVVGAGGRIIKTIGDEVMFSSSEEAGPEIALRLAEAFSEPDQPMVRVGLASGPVVSRSGDLYGPVVNLAARATAIAHPGTVVVSPAVRERLADDDRYAFRRIRPRRLKGIGFVELSVLRRARGA